MNGVELKPLILASSSRWRKLQLEQVGLSFEVQRPDFDERPLESRVDLAGDIALALAIGKARSLPLPLSGLIIAGDQTAVCAGKPLGKPATQDEARRQLLQCSGQTAHFHSAAVLRLQDHDREEKLLQAVSSTRVIFRRLSPAEIDRYLAYEDVSSCAGAFRVESLGISLFESVSSDDPTALVGFPLIALCGLLRSVGVQVP